MTNPSHRLAVAAVTLTYVAVTVGESILAPILPIASTELGLSAEEAGRILGLLSASAGVGNLIGGGVLSKLGSRTSSLAGLGLTVLGASLAAVESGVSAFMVAHVLLGLGAGVFFAGGIYSISALSDSERRGRAMGSFGIAYSLALALAAGLVAVIGPTAWRGVFAIAAGLGVLAIVAVMAADLPPRSHTPPQRWVAGLRLLAVPIAVGGAAAVAQFGLVAFVPTFAVDEWGYAASLAAMVLFLGRVLSIPGKAWAGRLSDRHGAIGAARIVVVTMLVSGAVWLLSPIYWIGAVAAVAFAGATGALFPVANVVAIERTGGQGGLLGLFRSAQMVLAGVSAWLVGLSAASAGLRLVLGIGVAALAALLLVSQTDAEPQHSST
ncbi:MAG: MFS transporter [Acidimicrobiia bacterium]|nr:MFS transporter [Acidimicrobiia bacterium]